VKRLKHSIQKLSNLKLSLLFSREEAKTLSSLKLFPCLCLKIIQKLSNLKLSLLFSREEAKTL
jgi:hypothetical protein